MVAAHESNTRLAQAVMLEALTALDTELKGKLQALCKKRSLDWDTWRKDTCLCFRIAHSHVCEKSRHYSRAPQGVSFRSHPDWLISLYALVPQHARAEISRRMVRFSCRDLSYETDSGPKTKTGNRPFSRPLKKLNNFLRHPKRRWVQGL